MPLDQAAMAWLLPDSLSEHVISQASGTQLCLMQRVLGDGGVCVPELAMQWLGAGQRGLHTLTTW